MSKLFTRDDQGKKTREEFQRLVRERAMDPSADSKDIEEKWSVVKAALCEAAQSILGNECSKHPDWFREKAATLKPLLEKRNKLYTKFLSSKKEHDKSFHCISHKSYEGHARCEEQLVPEQGRGSAERKIRRKVCLAVHQGHPEREKRLGTTENSDGEEGRWHSLHHARRTAKMEQAFHETSECTEPV